MLGKIKMIETQNLYSSNEFSMSMEVQDNVLNNFRNFFDLQLNSISDNSLELPVNQKAKQTLYESFEAYSIKKYFR